MNEEKYNNIRQECWNKALHSFGTAFIFGERAKLYNKYLSSIKFIGIVVPVVIGATVIGYDIEYDLLKYLIYLAVPISIIQVVISSLAVVYKWDDKLSYSYESASENNQLASKFESLGKNPPEKYEDLLLEYEKTYATYQCREKQDEKHSVSEEEKRFGMRYALRYFRRTCSACKETPISMESTDCYVCGKFKKKIK